MKIYHIGYTMGIHIYILIIDIDDGYPLVSSDMASWKIPEQTGAL